MESYRQTPDKPSISPEDDDIASQTPSYQAREHARAALWCHGCETVKWARYMSAGLQLVGFDIMCIELGLKTSTGPSRSPEDDGATSRSTSSLCARGQTGRALPPGVPWGARNGQRRPRTWVRGSTLRGLTSEQLIHLTRRLVSYPDHQETTDVRSKLAVNLCRNV